jgi:hypothetical protein
MTRKKTDLEFLNTSLHLMQFCEQNKLDKKLYFLKADEITGKNATIAKHGSEGSISMALCGRYYSHGELTAWMNGYTYAKNS